MSEALYLDELQAHLRTRIAFGYDEIGADSPWLRFHRWTMRRNKVPTRADLAELYDIGRSTEFLKDASVSVGAAPSCDFKSIQGHLARLWELERGVSLGEARDEIKAGETTSWDTSAARQALDNLKLDADRLDVAWMARSATIQGSDAWQQAFAGWKADYPKIVEYADDSWAGFASYSVVQGYQQRLAQWETTLKGFGGAVQGPPVSPPLDPPASVVPFALGMGTLVLALGMGIGLVMYIKR